MDDQIELDIQAASAAAEAFCSRVFARETVTELLDLTALGDVPLERAPLVGDVTALELDGRVIDVGLLTAVDPDHGVLRFVGLGGHAGLDTPGQLVGGWGWYQGAPGFGGGVGSATYGYRPVRRVRQLSITYTGGWVVPLPPDVTPPAGWATPNLPADVEMAVWLSVRAAGQRTARPTDAVSERFADYAVAYASGVARTAGVLSDDSRALLAPWARALPV